MIEQQFKILWHN